MFTASVSELFNNESQILGGDRANYVVLQCIHHWSHLHTCSEIVFDIRIKGLRVLRSKCMLLNVDQFALQFGKCVAVLCHQYTKVWKVTQKCVVWADFATQIFVYTSNTVRVVRIEVLSCLPYVRKVSSWEWIEHLIVKLTIIWLSHLFYFRWWLHLIKCIVDLRDQ